MSSARRYGNPVYEVGKRLMFEGLFRSGLVHGFRRNSRGSVLVLIYHDILPSGFPEDSPLFGMTVRTTEFEWQLAYLRRHYTPISFQQFANWFVEGAPLPENPVLVTFDDGHVNNFEFALPILLKFEMSAVFFVVSGSLGCEKPTWFEDAYSRLMCSSSKSWKLRSGEVLPLRDQQQRAAACGRFFNLCRNLSQIEQSTELQSLRLQLPISALNSTYKKRFEFLSAGQILSLKHKGMEIGAHTVTHPILRSLPLEQLMHELAASKSKLEDVTQQPLRALAYPFGAPGLDYAEREMACARQSGFSFAFAGEGGQVRRSDSPFSLPRVGIGRMTRAQFAATITGATDSIKATLSRRNWSHASAS